MTSDAIASSKLFRSLRARNYALYFAGQLASMFGTQVQIVALSWLVLDLTGEGRQVGGVIALQYGTLLVVSPIAGMVIDRIERRWAVISAETFLAAQATILAVIVLTDQTQLWMLYVLAMTQGAGSALEVPARQALVAEIVPPHDLSNAIALNGTLFTLAQITGPAVAGVLIVAIGIGPCFLLNAASFLAIIVAVLAMRTSEMFLHPTVRSERGQIRQGFKYVFTNPFLRMLCAGPLVTGMFLGVTAAVYPQLAKFTFGGDAGAYGLMGTMIGVGSAIGALTAARVRHITTRLIMVAAGGTGTALLATALAPTLAVEYLVLPFAGAFVVLQAVATVTTLQLTTAPELRGRVVAIYFMVSAAGASLGAFALGSLAESWGPRWAIGVNVVVAFTLCGAWARYRRKAHAGGIATTDDAKEATL